MATEEKHVGEGNDENSFSVPVVAPLKVQSLCFSVIDFPSCMYFNLYLVLLSHYFFTHTPTRKKKDGMFCLKY